MKPVKIGLLGLGTVGGGMVTVLGRNGGEIARRAGRAIEVTRIATRTPARAARHALEGVPVSDDPHSVIDDPAIEVVVELIGGLEPARSLTLAAIERGKHVVTANKALVAIHGNELFRAARERGVMVAFEAAVAGGIPIIKTIREALAGNRIEWIAGIINGTSNYILSAMREQGQDFDAALAEAQRLGYAEADPTFDIDGTDAAHKLTILASIAYGIPLQFDRACVEGITGLSRMDVDYAAELGYRVKLLGITRRTDTGVELRAHPCLVPASRLMANVEGVMNAVLVRGDAVGPLTLCGAGAGAEATASAVVADLVDVVRALTTDPENRVPHLAFQPEALSDLQISPMEQVRAACYLRVQALDRPGVLADITRIFGELGISIEAVRQQEPAPGSAHVPVVFLTQVVEERYMNQAIERVEALDSVAGAVMRIRVEPLE